jgi:hypothetical protein
MRRRRLRPPKMMRILGACVIATGIFFPIIRSYAGPAHSPTFADVIKEKGTISLTDGSSLFKFCRDGSFSQEPLGNSGRTVQGKWTRDANGELFTITGNWGWMNGISPASDPRKMVIAIYPGELGTTIKRWSESVPIYKCYFEIEELIKIPADTSVNTLNH